MNRSTRPGAVLLAGALVGLTPLVAAPVATATTPDGVVTEADATRQTENTPPTDDLVVYTRAGTPAAAATFVDGPGTPPQGTGSLQLSTATGGEKVFLFDYDHVSTPLRDIDSLSYATYRVAGSAQQVAAVNLQVDYNGDAAGGFTTLVFEPVYNTDQGAVVSGEWQTWELLGGATWWSTQPINGQCGGATSTCDKTWAEIVANNPDAVITGGVGINQGSGNPGLVTAVDAFAFDGEMHDFERVRDSDGDGVRDDVDAFPNDPAETTDSDGDGVGDNTDAFPTNPNETKDSDGDGVGDNTDAFPTNPNEAKDSDGDGVGDNADTNSKEDCKNSGWTRFTSPVFRNQGDCVSYFSGRKRP